MNFDERGDPFPFGHDDEDGVLILYGDIINRGINLGNKRHDDVTPTILAAMGVPIAKDMYGRVLVDAFHHEFFSRHPIRYIDSFEVTERQEKIIKSDVDDAVKNRLRALGYL